jgi:iron complex outermembrane receptor protein
MVSVQFLLRSTAAAALIAAVGAPAFAADPPQVEEVVVTAQKRAENVQSVPISMEVLTSKRLTTFHSDNLKALAVPNMNVGEIGGNQVIYMRGFGSPSQNYAFDQSVSLYVDGVYAGKSKQFAFPFFDQERVEVLRGPQGALFGKNTAAGAISIISAQPTQKFQGEATAIYNFGLHGYELSGVVSGPLTDRLAARLAVKTIDNDGYMKNLALDRWEPSNKSQLVRLSMKYFGDQFDYYAKVEYGHLKSRGNVTVSGPLTTGQEPVLTRYAVDNSILGPAGFDTTTWNVAGVGNLHLGEFTLTSVSGYSFFDAGHVNSFDQTIPGGGVTPPTVYNSYPEHFQQFSQEVRLQSPLGGKFDYIVGAYYDNSQYKNPSFAQYNLPIGHFLALTDFEQQAESYSIFGQGVYHFTDHLRLVGSLRYSHTSKRGFFFGTTAPGSSFALRPTSTAHGDISEGKVDPSATLQYVVAPRVMVYATYGQGSKSGGFVSNTFGTTDANFTFRPEKSQNIELGVKSTLFNGTLVANAAIYRIKFEDLQVSTYNPNTQAFVVANAASATGKGIEGSLTWYPIHNLDITGSAAYQDVKYDDFPGASCLASQPISQCNPLVPASVAANNIAGSPLPNISKFSANVQAHYVIDLPRDLKLGTTVGVDARTQFFNSDDESPLYGLQPGYAKLNARVELTPADSRWRVAVVGTNLNNALTTSGSFRLPFPITTVTRAIYWVDQPRNISLEANVRF